MEELLLRLLEKQITTKWFFYFEANDGTMKNVIALNLYIGTNDLVYERRLMVKVWSMIKFSVHGQPACRPNSFAIP